jgi:hypothetical protein
MLIDDALFEDRKTIKKETEKIFKYTDFKLEIRSMWNVKAKVTPVTIWATEHLQITRIIPE